VAYTLPMRLGWLLGFPSHGIRMDECHKGRAETSRNYLWRGVESP